MRRLPALLTLCALIGVSGTAWGQAANCEEPNVLITLDRSGSMLEDRKWQQAVDAVTQLTRTFEFRIRFGLLAFPWDGRCSVRSPNAVLAPVAPFNGPNIQAQLAQAFPQERNKTPLAAAINESVNYYFQLNDPSRRSFIVLVTDGMETCGGNPINAAANAWQNAGFRVYVIGFGNGVDRNILNRMAQEGGTDRAYQANNGPELFAALEEIADAASEETCDGLDNDCDGEVDEGIGDQACTTACGDGRQICVDGQFSECFGGSIPEETCDAVDNDCDTRIDEIPGVPCTTTSGNPGLAACIGGMVDDDCIPDDPTREEVCDAWDNDEDGQIDENTDQPCNNECHQGRRRCIDGAYLGCSALEVGEERCDGVDNDCDGLVDESAPCVGDEVCGAEGLCLSACPFNECPGGFVCQNDGYCHPIPCEPACADGQRCIDQQCLTECVIDRDCPDGWRCNNRLCEPAPGGVGGSGGGAGGGVGGTGGAGGSGVGQDQGVTPRLDAGAPAVDGGLPKDIDGEGCHCDVDDSRPTPWAALFLLVLVGLRRRR